MQDQHVRQKIRERYHNDAATESNGPVARLKQVAAEPCLSALVDALVDNDGLNVEEWRHNLREAWRLKYWRLTAHGRQAYAGIENGVDRKRTLAYLSELQGEADRLQLKLDRGEGEAPAKPEDPRAKMGLMRRLIGGGLLTTDRLVRHSGGVGAQCACGAVETIEHVSWACPLHRHDRRPALEAIRGICECYTELPPCFRYATVVPSSFAITGDAVTKVQKAILRIWQARIQNWHDGGVIAAGGGGSGGDGGGSGGGDGPGGGGDDGGSGRGGRGRGRGRAYGRGSAARGWGSGGGGGGGAAASSSADADTIELAREVDENGHRIRAVPPEHGEGIFCVKCGKCFKIWKQKCRIIEKPCKQKNLPEAKWLSKPGSRQSESKLSDMDIVERHNKGGHNLEWNHKIGKIPFAIDEGLVRCKTCEQAWEFREAIGNMSRSICPGTPDRVNRARAKSKAGIVKWKSENPASHDIHYDEKYLRWRCQKCGINSGCGYGERFDDAVATACLTTAVGGLSGAQRELRKRRGIG